MSVIVRNMEMPISCAECPIGGSMRCALIPGVPAWCAEYDQCVEEKKLHSQCPLIPVPPHGRLGDLDNLAERIEFEVQHYVVKDEFDKGRIAGWNNILRAIREYAPTIVPADPTKEAVQK